MAKDAEIAELKSKVEELTKLVLTLKEQLDRSSSNSNKPPSTDSPAQKAERRGMGTGGKRGGQPGHSGSTRELVPPEQVSKYEPLFPPECENCFARLPQLSDEVQRFQTVEPPQIKAYVIEVLRYRVACPNCKHKTWASIAPIPKTPFGPHLEAVIGLATGVYHLSRRAAVSWLSDVLGIDISLGAVSAVEERVSEAVRPAVAEAWAKFDEAPVKHTDGTSWFKAGVLCSPWTIATSAVTVFKILANDQATTLASLAGTGPHSAEYPRGEFADFRRGPTPIARPATLRCTSRPPRRCERALDCRLRRQLLRGQVLPHQPLDLYIQRLGEF